MSDWYEMRSVQQFADRAMSFLNALTDVECKNADAQFFMGVMAGVNYIRPFSMHSMKKEFWADLQQKQPDIYAVFDDRLNHLILETYSRLKTDADPARTVDDIAKLSFAEKVELVACWHQLKSPQGEPPLKKARDAFPDPLLYDVINVRTRVVMNDIWSRTGVLTLQYRKSVVERLMGQKYPDMPLDSAAEPAWFLSMMNNKQFRKTYDAIDWTQVATAGREIKAAMPARSSKTLQDHPSP